jgi:hypothetical protein
MKEATALARRVELAVSGMIEPVVAGFRGTGHFSLYFGADPALHFDADGRLRRAYCDGHLYRTQGTTLAKLDRRRTASATELVRHDLSESELAEFRERVRASLASLQSKLVAGSARTLRQVPDSDTSVVADVGIAIDRVLNSGIELAPAIPGRR